jgi:hypothetical protein
MVDGGTFYWVLAAFLVWVYQVTRGVDGGHIEVVFVSVSRFSPSALATDRQKFTWSGDSGTLSDEGLTWTCLKTGNIYIILLYTTIYTYITYRDIILSGVEWAQ